MNQTPQPLADLQVFHGPVSPLRAEIYARIPSLQPAAGFRLEGQVSGPWSHAIRTLPARIELRNAGAGPTLLARAALPDPCPWTAEVPAVYRVRVDLYCASHLVASTEQTFGFRNLGIAAGRLYRSGQSWILRALPGGDATTTPWEDLQRAKLAAVAYEPDAELCRAATQRGVPLLVATAAAGEALRAQVLDWSRSVAVAVVLTTSVEPWPDDPHRWAPNLLFARSWPDSSGCGSGDRAAGTDLVVCPADRAAAAAAETSRRQLPLLVSRRVPAEMLWDERRAALNQLERESAAVGHPAGYLLDWER